MNSLGHVALPVLALGLLMCITISTVAQTTSTNQASTRDFTDRASFAAANGGSSKTVSFGGIRRGADFYSSYNHSPIAVSGITFSTSTPNTFVNVTSADYYSPRGNYADDFIVSSENPSSNNELTITLPCPTLAFGIDFGGLGFRGRSSATVTLSNGHTYNQTSLPTVGNTTFVGFVSSGPVTSLVLNTVNDSWVVEDIIVADCYAGQPSTPTPTPAPVAAFKQAIWKEMRNLSGSGSEAFTDDCAVGSGKTSSQGMPATPLKTILEYPDAPKLNLVVDQNGIWTPLDMTFTLTSAFIHFGGMFFPDLSNPQTSYHLTLSREGILTIIETGSANSFSPTGYFYRKLQGNATWSATQVIDLNSGQDTVNFRADLAAQYTGGAQPGTGKPLGVATTCTITSHYSGQYSAMDVIIFVATSVQPLDCAITSQTLATVPVIPNSRRRIGVGEVVALSTNVPARWAIKSGKACLNTVPLEKKELHECLAPPSIEESEVYFLAPYSTDDTVVTATLANGSSCSISFSTLQPTGLIFRRLEAPPLPAPGYGFQTPLDAPDTIYKLQMYSVVFVTPGDVSFANIGIAELDDASPHTTIPSNVLVSVGGNNAWLLSCDHNANSWLFPPSKAPVTWDYTYGSTTYAEATKVPFAKTLTTLSHTPGKDYVFEKVQVQALSPNGSWVDTADVLGSSLKIPWGTKNSDLPPLGSTPLKAYQACIPLVQDQFGSIQ